MANARDDLGCTLEHIVAEVRNVYADRIIELTTSLQHPVDCDPQRVAQLLGNLLSNAMTHGDPDAPVRVAWSSDAVAFEVWVENACAPIDPETLRRLFHPFTRGTFNQPQAGARAGSLHRRGDCQGAWRNAHRHVERRGHTLLFRMPPSGPGPRGSRPLSRAEATDQTWAFIRHPQPVGGMNDATPSVPVLDPG